jgi:hypothetical protein
MLGSFNNVNFDAVTTRFLRAELSASGSNGRHAAFGVEEFEADAPKAVAQGNLPPAPRDREACPAN